MEHNFKKSQIPVEAAAPLGTGGNTGLVFAEIPSPDRATGAFQQAPCRANLYKFVYVKSGSGQLIVDTMIYELRGALLYCIFPDQIHSITKTQGLMGNVITFPREYMNQGLYNFTQLFGEQLLQAVPGAACVELEGEALEDIDHLMGNIARQWKRESSLKQEILKEYMTIFYFILKKELKNAFCGSTLKKTEVAAKFFELIGSGYNKKEQVSDYASLLRVSPNYLNNVIKKVSGFPVSHHIQQRVLLEAKRQAVHTNLSMKEIAFYLGFEESSHFSKFFKKLTGNNFTEFRKLFADGAFQ